MRLASAPAAVLCCCLLAAGCGGGAASFPKRATPHIAPGENGTRVARLPGLSAADIAAAAVLANYPPGASQRPNGWILVTTRRWQDAMLGAQFIGPPLNGGLIVIDPRFIPTPSQDALSRLNPVPGFPLSKGIQLMLLGNAQPDVFLALKDLSLKVAQLKAATAAGLGLQLVPYRGGYAHGYSSQVMIASADDRAYTLPAAAWSAYSGDTIALVHHDSIPAATSQLLVQRQKLRAEKPTMYIVGPPSVISDNVASQLAAYGRVKRVAGPDAVTNAIAFARYRDPTTGFGWGLQHGPGALSLVNPRAWGSAIGAFDFAGGGPQAPLLLTGPSGQLTAPLLRYLRDMAAPQPTQAFVFGNPASIPSASLHQADLILSGAH
jgi:hypothetical protein